MSCCTLFGATSQGFPSASLRNHSTFPMTGMRCQCAIRTTPVSVSPYIPFPRRPASGRFPPKHNLARLTVLRAASKDEPPVCEDSLSDVAFIALCRKAYGELAGWQSPREWLDGEETYKGMVEVSRALMKGRTAEEQRNAIIKGFPDVPEWFRKVFPYSKWGAELNAKITPAFFKWLVGPMEAVEVEINGEMMKSGVHIEECRYLKESGCVGMCVNLCKAPCQTFFTEQLGMPLTMNPDFEDLSCEMLFGQKPPPLDEDPVAKQLQIDKSAKVPLHLNKFLSPGVPERLPISKK